MATVEGQAGKTSAGWFGWGATETQAGEKKTVAQLRDGGGTSIEEVGFRGQGAVKYSDGGWFRSVISPGTLFRAQVRDGGDSSVLFGKLDNVGEYGEVLDFSQSGDSRAVLKKATYVATGTQPRTVSVAPGSTSIVEKFGAPEVAPTTVRFFLGDSKVPVKIYDGAGTEPLDAYTFNPVSAADSGRPGRIQALQVRSDKDPTTGEVSLRILTQVDPTCLDVMGESKDACLGGMGSSVRFAGRAVVGSLNFGRTAVVNTLWGMRHPILAGQNLTDGTVRLLGGTPSDRMVVSDKPHTE